MEVTGLICVTKTFALTALAACGLLMAGGQLDTAGPSRASLENGTTAQAEQARGVDLSSDADANGSISSELISDKSACIDNCPAPCATACAVTPLQGSPLDGAVEVGVSLDAAVAPEHFCECQSEGPAGVLHSETEAEAEARPAAASVEASAEAILGNGLGGY